MTQYAELTVEECTWVCTNIAVDDEIASRLSKIAEREGKTAFALANECLGASFEICEQGGKPEEIYGSWKMNRIGKEVGAFQWIGRNLMEQLVREYGLSEPEKFSKIWRDAGYNFGVYLQICFPQIDDVVSLVEQLKQSFTIGRVQFVERTPNSPQEDHIFALNVVASLSAELLTFLAEFWRGLLSAYGLDVYDKIIATGAVRIFFVSREKLQKANPQLIA